MAFNIPLPGMPGDALLGGFNTVSNQMARLLQAKLQREQMAQQGQQFGQTFGLQKAQEDRLAALSPFQQRLLEAQAQQAEQEARQLALQQEIINSFLGGQSPAMPMSDTVPGVTGRVTNPNGGEASQGSSSRLPNFNNLSIENPILAGFIKHATKGAIDPTLETPAMKSNREFQDFTRKEEYKKNVSKDLLTPSRIDALQKSVIGIDQVLPMLEELKKTKPGKFGGWWSPSDQAEYEGIVSNIIEPLLASKSLTGTVENSNAMRATVERKNGEDFDRWLKRIDNEIAIVKRIKKENINMLGEGKVIPKSFENDKATVKFNPVTGKFE